MKLPNDITVVTVNFNVSILTNCMLLSLKRLCDFNALVIDNSSYIKYNKPSQYDFVEVFDNMMGKFSGYYSQISQNHCSTIDMAFKKLVKTKYALLCDSDILFKSNALDSIINDYKDYDAIGEVGWDDAPPNRLLPYFCLINVEKMNDENISYFDVNRCIERNGRYDGARGANTVCFYHDTGSSFLEDIKDTWSIKNIKLNDVIVHKKNGSCGVDLRPDIWLNAHKDLWSTDV